MLYITPHIKRIPFRNYQEAVSFLASNTVAYYSGQPIRPRGPNFPSYDVSEVCCWLSEQPLRNGMQLCTLNNGSSQIALIAAPEEDANEHMDVEKEMPPLVPDNLLLISSDCYEGLKRSLDYLNTEEDQQLIRNPADPSFFVTDPKNPEHYIWPTRLYDLPGNPTSKLTSQNCFIYTKKMALVQYLSEKRLEGENDIEMKGKPLQVDVETLREFLFVEANPLLPDDLYVKAQNTIRLFQLNGRNYDYVKDLRYHFIGYNTSNQENEYDDLRPEGRSQAFKRARKSLSQLRTMQTFMVDAETLQTFISQYKILIELTGYRSIWATVFNDGEDPGRFNDIMGVPAPTAPLIPDLIPDTGRKRKRVEEEQDILDVTDTNRMTDVIQDELGRYRKKRKLNDKEDEEVKFDLEQFIKNLNIVTQNLNLWVARSKRIPKRIPRKALAPKPVVDVLISNKAVQCSKEFLDGFSQEVSMNFTLCNAPFILST